MYKSIWLLCSIAVTGFGTPDSLSLDQALNLARMNSPSLKAARLQTQAAEKVVPAYGRRADPVLKFEAEGLGGDLDGFSDAEYTLAVEQTFTRGAKRKSERSAAEKAIVIAFEREAEKEQVLLAEVRRAFITVFAQQEIGKVRSEQEQLGRAFVEVAKRRHASGGGSELDVAEAELALEEILLSQTCCFGDLQAARDRLAGLIGIPEKKIGELVGTYYDLPVIESAALAMTHPVLRRKAAEAERVRAEARLAKAQDAADVKLGAGYKYEAAGDVNTFLLGASVPLNFTRKGRLLQAALLVEADALEAEQEELRRQLELEQAVLVSRYTGARLEAEMTRDRLIPKAEKAYALSQAGYEAGRFSWFELIRAQQHLADIRVRYIESVQSAQQFRADLSLYMKEGM